MKHQTKISLYKDLTTHNGFKIKITEVKGEQIINQHDFLFTEENARQLLSDVQRLKILPEYD